MSADPKPYTPGIEYSAGARAVYERELMLRRKVSLLPQSDPEVMELTKAIDRGIDVYQAQYPEVTP